MGIFTISRRAQMIIVAAAAVVVVVGLRYAQPFLVPVLFGAALAAISSPIATWVTRRGLPPAIGALAALVVDLGILVFVGAVVTIAGVELEEKVPAYLARASEMTVAIAATLTERGLPVNPEFLSKTLHTASLVPLLGGAAVTVASAASNLGVVLLVVFFALCEISGAGAKIRRLVSDPAGGLARIDRIVREVKKYLLVKTLTSLLVAMLAYVLLRVMNVDLALLMASSLFVLHFIPNIGAAIATIPAVLVALASQGPGTAAVVALGYLLINLLVGNVLEPRVLGRTLGLSPLAVLIGMLFWGWLWGPSGALLSVPIMMVAKITVENVEGLSWIARLMELAPEEGKEHEEEAHASEDAPNSLLRASVAGVRRSG
ncbi:membrane protein [Sorangium cellulosum]|uniref:Membrane protein n=1 Tax=Sorangium cellulosum TaxID=56 RepID=A0A2L0EU64_SORCE|nr:AI-2E family transporter [Sorangium cellulosum]AUX42819.1 membrane protein [Sorangium cellulosum]